MKESELIQRKKKLFQAFTYGVDTLCILCLLGFVVLLVMLGFGVSSSIVTILCGVFLGGTALFGILAALLYNQGEKWKRKELDALEREDSEFSFHVGEGTLATLEDQALVIHGGEEKRPVSVPYFDIKFYSICTRRAAREGGVWSVLIEIPAKYLNSLAKPGDKPVLVQTEGKDRLYDRIQALGRELIGEKPDLSRTRSEKPFERMKKFTKPDERQRRKVLILMGISIVMIVGGILTSTLLIDKIQRAFLIGGIVAIVGCYFGIRALLAFLQAKAVFSVYREGIYYQDSEGMERVFLKWEEILSAEEYVRSDGEVMRFTCPYGNYDFPPFEGALNYISEQFPEKVKMNQK